MDAQKLTPSPSGEGWGEASFIGLNNKVIGQIRDRFYISYGINPLYL